MRRPTVSLLLLLIVSMEKRDNHRWVHRMFLKKFRLSCHHTCQWNNHSWGVSLPFSLFRSLLFLCIWHSSASMSSSSLLLLRLLLFFPLVNAFTCSEHTSGYIIHQFSREVSSRPIPSVVVHFLLFRIRCTRPSVDVLNVVRSPLKAIIRRTNARFLLHLPWLILSWQRAFLCQWWDLPKRDPFAVREEWRNLVARLCGRSMCEKFLLIAFDERTRRH